MRTSWYSNVGKTIIMNGMFIICRILIKFGKIKRHGGGEFISNRIGSK